MDSKNKTPKQEPQNKKEQAINKKRVPTDGEKIYRQVKGNPSPRDHA